MKINEEDGVAKSVEIISKDSPGGDSDQTPYQRGIGKSEEDEQRGY